MERRGHRFCRYADDCNIYVRSLRAGDRVMGSVSRFLTTQLRLQVNVSKSAVARPEERKFLGFRITNDGSQRQIAPQALERFKTRVRELTRRTLGVSVPQLVEQLAPYLIGWRGYFGVCDTPPSARHAGRVDSPEITDVPLAAVAERAAPLPRTAPTRRLAVQRSRRRWVTDRVLAHVRPPGRSPSAAQPLFSMPSDFQEWLRLPNA